MRFSYPCCEYTEVDTDSRVQIEQYLPASLNNGVQWPGVAPLVEARLDSNVVERR